MRKLPLAIGVIHFVGIGGIGMSGIAEVLCNLGYFVQGSDIASNANVKRLCAMGIQVAIGHKEENLGEAEVVVISSAVKADNPEVLAARRRHIPVVRRAEMLGELMRLKRSIAIGGTHGKTTTTSLIASVLDAAGLDPTVINGGIINAWDTNARLGGGEWVVAEADESDGTFVKLPATITVVTNMDPEHLDHYGSLEAMCGAYAAFVENIPFYGFAILCIDHPRVQAMISRIIDRKVVAYGFSQKADVRGVNLEHRGGEAIFDAVIAGRKGGESRVIKGLFLPMAGRHNVQNALAAVAVAVELEIEEQALRQALADFKGVKRRFTKVGEVDGVSIIDDYGHHPVEIAAVLEAARSVSKGQVIAVVQPHRYTRLSNLFSEFCACFDNADRVLVADVYSAGEKPIAGADQKSLVAGICAHGRQGVIALQSPKELAGIINDIARPGDIVVCLGAGDITVWANQLPGEMEKLRRQAKEANG